MELEKLKSMRKNLILIATLELIGGLFMIICCANSLDIIAKMLGIVAAAYGIITFLVWLVKKEKSNSASVIITAILGVTAGAFLIFFTDNIKEIFSLLVGILTAIFGILKLPNMFGLKKAGYKRWAFILIPIGITVVLGILIGLNSYLYFFGDSTAVTSVLFGISLISDCATDILSVAGASETEKGLSESKEIIESNPENKN